jgi:hypothetical protein
VTFDLAQPLISSGADANGLQAWFSTWQGLIGYEIRNLNITARADTVFCRSLNRLSGSTTDGEKEDVWFRQTLCLRKIRADCSQPRSTSPLSIIAHCSPGMARLVDPGRTNGEGTLAFSSEGAYVDV